MPTVPHVTAETPTQVKSSIEQAPAVPAGLIGAVLALVGAFPLPYAYYPFLRVALCVTAVTLVVFAIRSEKLKPAIPAVPIVILWLPSALVVLPRGVWQVLDVVVAGVLVVMGLSIKAPPSRSQPGEPDRRLPWFALTGVVYAVAAVVALAFLWHSGGACTDVSYDHSGSTCSDY